MEISTESVKNLRDKTGISIMQCRKALVEAGGDMEKAIIILEKNSKAIASKKSERALGAGTIQAYIHGAGTVGAMVELMSETDFVAKNDDFKALAREIAMHVAAINPQFVRKEDIGEDEKKKAMEVFAEEVKGKPENIKEKILEGKLSAFFGEKTLLSQPFFKNQEVTVSQVIESAIQKFGEKIEVGRIARFGTAR